MFLVEWDYIYNPKSDSWEIVSNNGWASKSSAEDYIKEINKAETLTKQLEQANKVIDEITKEVITSMESLESLNKSHQEKYDKSNDSSYIHTITTNQQVLDYLIPLKSILSQYKEGEKQDG